jgi:hypothetical protein
LLSAHVPDDGGYFGEQLDSARNQMVRAWKVRAPHLDSHFRQTDILGALQLASQILAQQLDADRRTLVVFSDMRQSTTDLNLESPKVVPPFSTVAKRCDVLPALNNIQIDVLGVERDAPVRASRKAYVPADRVSPELVDQ